MDMDGIVRDMVDSNENFASTSVVPSSPRQHGRGGRFRRWAGLAGAVLSVVFIVWLPLGIVEVLPFTLKFPGESNLRTHAAAAVACLMLTAWAWWEE